MQKNWRASNAKNYEHNYLSPTTLATVRFTDVEVEQYESNC